jgi:hypothetical protein
MKTRDEIERELCRCILSAAQSEADAGRGFLVPPDCLADLRPPQRATVDTARRACGISDKTWDREFRIHEFVAEIRRGVRKHHRTPA